MRLKLVALLSCVLLSLGFAQDSIKVGVISSFTGRFAEFGDQHKAGFQVALEEINANGGINGVPLELVIEDDTSDQKAALSSAEKLAQAGLPMVLGAYSSSITNPLAQYFTREQLPFVVFTSSADSITNPGSDWVYRINQPAATYAEILFDVFDYLRSEGQDINNVAVVHGNGTFENAVAIASQELALTRGYRIVELQSYDKGLTDFRPILNRFKSKNPDVILMVSYSEDAVAIVRQVKELGVAPKVMVGAAAGFALPSFIEGAQDAAEGVITATAWTAEVNYEGAQDLYERLVAAKGGEPSYHAAQAYAGLITAADVLRRSSDMSPESIRQALSETNLSTAYGPITFSDYAGYRNQNPVKMVAEQVQGGAFITIYTQAGAVTEILLGGQ